MLINLKNNFHWLVYSTGLFVYFVMLAQTTLTLSVIWLLVVLYAWLVVSIITQQYSLKCCLYVFCFSGIMVALSVFFTKGIEELPLPVGAILFKEEGILQALLLLFVFSVPLLIYNHNKIVLSWLQADQLNTKQTSPIEPNLQNIQVAEKWEEATIEDLESGSYEPI